MDDMYKILDEVKRVEKSIELGEHIDSLFTMTDINVDDEETLKNYLGIIKYIAKFNLLNESIGSIKDVDEYIEKMNEGLENNQQLMVILSVLFGSISEEELDNSKYLKIINDKSKILIKYLKFEDYYNHVLPDKIDHFKKILEYLKLVVQNQDAVREYMQFLRNAETLENEEIIVRDRLSREKLELSTYSDIQSFIFNSLDINDLKSSIKEDENKVATYEENWELKTYLESNLRDAGLGDIIDAFNYTYGEGYGKPEQVVVDYIKILMHKDGIDLSKVIEAVDAKIQTLSNVYDVRVKLLDRLYKDDELKKLIYEDYEAIKEYVDIKNNKIKNNSRIVSAYVLNKLLKSNMMSYEEFALHRADGFDIYEDISHCLFASKKLEKDREGKNLL